MRRILKILFIMSAIYLACMGIRFLGNKNTPETFISTASSENVQTESPEENTVVAEDSGVVYVTDSDGNETAFGDASFYDYDFDAGGNAVPCPSRSGDCYTHGRLLAASRDFKRWSTVKVTNLANGKSVEVLITDFGPDESEFPERILDLSSTAFSRIADLDTGVILVKAEWPVPEK